MKLGGLRTSFIEAGPTEAPVVFLIHDGALGADAQLCWSGVIEELKRDYHIYAPDLLGYGRSEKVTFFNRSPYGPRIDQIAQLCDHLGITGAHFIGTSFGGSVLLRAVACSPCPWPLTTGISICGTGGPFRYEKGKRILASSEPSLEGIKKITSLLVASDIEDNHDHVVARLNNALYPGHWESLSAVRLRGPGTPKPPEDNYPAALSNCSRPLLLIEGIRDVLLEAGWSEKLKKLSPNVENTYLDTAHSPNIDAVDLLVATIRSFLIRFPNSRSED